MQPATPAVLANHQVRVRQLANAMYELNNQAGGCTREALLQEGFSPYELETMTIAARGLANKRFVRQVDADRPSDDELIDRGVSSCTGLVNVADIVAMLRQQGGTPTQISRIWDRLMPKIASAIACLPVPKVA